MNEKSSLVFWIILGLFLAALLSRTAALALMTLPFLAYLAAGILTTPQEIRLSASRMVSHHRCEADIPVTMTVIIDNNGLPVPRLQIHESFEPKFRFVRMLEEPAGILPAGGRVELQYAFQAPRGRYRWQNVQVTVSDPFGLFEKTIDITAEVEVLVLPDRPPIVPQKLNPRNTLRAPGFYLSRQPGSGVDYFGVREYHQGDPLRWIHWRKTARHPNLFFTKEFEREEIADIGLILDGSAAINLKKGSEELFDNSIQAAVALTRSVLRGGNRLSMLILGEQVARVFPGTGKHQLEHVLDQLAVCQPGENVSLNTIKYLPVKLFPSHALIILVSPLREEDIAAIARLIASRYQLIVISPDPVRFARGDPSSSLASRIALVERRVLLRRIRGMGAKVIDWPVTQPLIIGREKMTRHI